MFGEQFHYTGCLQHTSKGETQLRHLDPGSLILFGSCKDRARFVLDTVFVVAARRIGHSRQDHRRTLTDAVSSTYWQVTVEFWYGGNVTSTYVINHLTQGKKIRRDLDLDELFRPLEKGGQASSPARTYPWVLRHFASSPRHRADSHSTCPK